MSQFFCFFFVATCILDVRQSVKMLCIKIHGMLECVCADQGRNEGGQRRNNSPCAESLQGGVETVKRF